MPYFGEPVGRVKIQTTSKNSQRYYTTKRLRRDLLSNTPNWYVRANFVDIYLQGMRDRSMRRSGTVQLDNNLGYFIAGKCDTVAKVSSLFLCK